MRPPLPGPEVRALLRKELVQLSRSRTALATALVLPLLLLVVVPVSQMLAPGAEGLGPGGRPLALPGGLPLPPGLHAAVSEPRGLVRLLLPVLVTLGGVVVPVTTMVHALIHEREGRTLELLVALPVRVGHILLAKVAAVLAVAVPVTFCLYAVTAAVLLRTGTGGPALALALWGLLVSALAFSTCSALLVSLLARDFRTANNLSGLAVLPTVLLGLLAAFLLPGPLAATGALAAALLLAAAGCLWAALRVVTFERLLH
jgi:ABC-type Na+ efflux pump permease subunit